MIIARDRSGKYFLGCALAMAMLVLLQTTDAKGGYLVLHTFDGAPDGSSPAAGLLRFKGNYFGTTINGGASGYGTVFKLSPHGEEAVLYSFTGGSDGSEPALGTLIADRYGNLYGTTPEGGELDCGEGNGLGRGAVFKLTPNGVETVLHSFAGGEEGHQQRPALSDRQSATGVRARATDPVHPPSV